MPKVFIKQSKMRFAPQNINGCAGFDGCTKRQVASTPWRTIIYRQRDKFRVDSNRKGFASTGYWDESSVRAFLLLAFQLSFSRDFSLLFNSRFRLGISRFRLSISSFHFYFPLWISDHCIGRNIRLKYIARETLIRFEILKYGRAS